MGEAVDWENEFAQLGKLSDAELAERLGGTFDELYAGLLDGFSRHYQAHLASFGDTPKYPRHASDEEWAKYGKTREQYMAHLDAFEEQQESKRRKREEAFTAPISALLAQGLAQPTESDLCVEWSKADQQYVPAGWPIGGRNREPLPEGFAVSQGATTTSLALRELQCQLEAVLSAPPIDLWDRVHRSDGGPCVGPLRAALSGLIERLEQPHVAMKPDADVRGYRGAVGAAQRRAIDAFAEEYDAQMAERESRWNEERAQGSQR